MRKIKFRVWDNLKKTFLKNKRYYLETDGTLKQHEKGFIVQQFTGLKDKNEQEIYEGDIVFAFMNQRNYVVKFGVYDRDIDYESSKQYGFYILNINENNSEYGESMANSNLYLEVVGNIFENPELLKNNA